MTKKIGTHQRKAYYSVLEVAIEDAGIACHRALVHALEVYREGMAEPEKLYWEAKTVLEIYYAEVVYTEAGKRCARIRNAAIDQAHAVRAQAIIDAFKNYGMADLNTSTQDITKNGKGEVDGKL